jgi:hypothetical protein
MKQDNVNIMDRLSVKLKSEIEESILKSAINLENSYKKENKGR